MINNIIIFNEYFWKLIYVRGFTEKFYYIKNVESDNSVFLRNDLYSVNNSDKNYYNIYMLYHKLYYFPYDFCTRDNFYKKDIYGTDNLTINCFELLSCNFELLTYLKIINIIWSKIMILPSNIKLLINLRELYIFGNNLTRLPTEIGLLVNLKLINASDNKLQYIPTEIGLLNLRHIIICHNLLIILPSEIALNNLYLMNVNGNRLLYLPTEIRLCKELTCWDLHNNELKISSIEKI